ESLDAHRLRGVVAAVEDVDPQLLRVEEGPVRSFTRNEGVETCGGSLRNEGAPRPGHDPDACDVRRPEGEHARRNAKDGFEFGGELLASHAEIAPHTDRRAVVRAELATQLDPEQSREDGVVAHAGVAVEGKVGGV